MFPKYKQNMNRMTRLGLRMNYARYLKSRSNVDQQSKKLFLPEFPTELSNKFSRFSLKLLTDVCGRKLIRKLVSQKQNYGKLQQLINKNKFDYQEVFPD